MSLAPGPAVFGVVRGSSGCFSHQDLQAQGPRQPLRTLPAGHTHPRVFIPRSHMSPRQPLQTLPAGHTHPRVFIPHSHTGPLPSGFSPASSPALAVGLHPRSAGGR